MIEFASVLYEIVIWLFLIYSIAIVCIYSWIAVYAYGALNQYHHKNLFTDYNLIVTNPNVPKYSLVAPAYNEGLTIVENVRSLLSLYYNNLEIIIVNDGSKDNSIPLLIKAYQLEPTAFFVEGKIKTKAIKGVYRSKNPAFKKLIVVDKENGGKADALNVGINISTGDYLVCIDVDCILEQDAILKLAKPFLEQTDKRIIACGGVIRLANNCEVKDGKVTDVRLPDSWLGRCQALEYIRAFVLGRMAWSRASGLILISGAFGAFDKEIVLACGGYDSATVGEDMELVVRMRRYMEEQNLPYEVVNIPDPLCWTEVPESKEILRKQRNRWMRGTIETLWKHRKMMFNPQYGKLGMVSLPYWFFFEFLGPVIEFIGYFIFIAFLFLGIINWQFFFALFALVISSGILYSIFAILVDLMSHKVYTKKADLSKLITAAIIEPFYFHPIVVRASVNGLNHYFRNQHGWGEMTRQGFSKKNKDMPLMQRILNELSDTVKEFTRPALIFLLVTVITSLIEYKWYTYKLIDLVDPNIGVNLLANNFDFALQTLTISLIIYQIVKLVFPRRAWLVLVSLLGVLLFFHYPLFLYFAESRNLLGSDAFIYSYTETIQILKTSGMLNMTNIAFCIILIAFLAFSFILFNKTATKKPVSGIVIYCCGLFAFIWEPNQMFTHNSEAAKNAASSKVSYFINSNIKHRLEVNENILPKWLIQQISEEIDEDYPFLKPENTPDFLGKYFQQSPVTPNLVIIILEGIGHAYSSDRGYIGNFTPFLDSLAKKSLYWENSLSSSGRTFAAIPTITGSLPFGHSGFLEINPQPNNFNLFNILQKNNFETGFYYGGNAGFDNMESFLNTNKGIKIVDQNSFSALYTKLPGSDGESWGYEDQALYKKLLESNDLSKQPYFKLVLTLSTHNPFSINNYDFYEERYEAHLKKLNLTPEKIKWAIQSKKALVSIISSDHALEQFMEEYSTRSDFGNTVFVITADHASPEIPFQEKINRYHVPLLIYSPLLKTPQAFNNYVSHFDIAPSILAFYRENYQINVPQTVTWIGEGLAATSLGGYPMMQSKTQLIDYIYRDYHLVDNALFKINAKLNEEVISDEVMKKHVEKHFRIFKEKNRIFYNKKELLPDSVFKAFFD